MLKILHLTKVAPKGELLHWLVLRQNVDLSASLWPRAAETPGHLQSCHSWNYVTGTINGDVFHQVTLGPFAAQRSSPFLFSFHILRCSLPDCITCMSLEDHSTVPRRKAGPDIRQSVCFNLFWSTEGPLLIGHLDAVLPHLEYCRDLTSTRLSSFAFFQPMPYASIQSWWWHFSAYSPLVAPLPLQIRVSSLVCHVRPGSLWTLHSSPASSLPLISHRKKAYPHQTPRSF